MDCFVVCTKQLSRLLDTDKVDHVILKATTFKQRSTDGIDKNYIIFYGTETYLFMYKIQKHSAVEKNVLLLTESNVADTNYKISHERKLLQFFYYF